MSLAYRLMYLVGFTLGRAGTAMVRLPPPALVVLALALVVAVSPSGCGGGSREERPLPGGGAGERPVPGASAAPGAPAGRGVFLSQCQACHALGQLGASRPAGGDLANYNMTAAEVRSFARIMPTPRPLSRAELEAVSRFVASAQRRQRTGSDGSKAP